MSGRATGATAALNAYSPFLFKLFARYLDRYFAANFTAVRVLKPGLPHLPAGRPPIFFSNHVSWWDPIFYVLIAARLLPGYRSFGPIDAASLRKYRFLRRLGIFPVEQNTARGAAQFLTTARGLLAAPGTALWITPQGRFADSRERPIAFRPGLAHLARDVPDAVLVPVALEYPFWSERRPEALFSFGPIIDPRDHGDRTAAQWNALLEQRMIDQMERLAAAAIARDPERFDELVVGRARVSPAYDGWRWLRARVRGERFSAAHED
ncbi:lysophospholipid acyltransferase family protein [Rhodoligotrophos defluvii]|uniref:lysophospholipid acyltransferase family protein n=1 Tax=Rhodoligotrophos defluvii TaxID=2561934 RepID=UPI001484E9F6|nr:lysophospholipid acyltransferase family protein [Rhodoligotrophos defluvii]